MISFDRMYHVNIFDYSCRSQRLQNWMYRVIHLWSFSRYGRPYFYDRVWLTSGPVVIRGIYSAERRFLIVQWPVAVVVKIDYCAVYTHAQ